MDDQAIILHASSHGHRDGRTNHVLIVDHLVYAMADLEVMRPLEYCRLEKKNQFSLDPAPSHAFDVPHDSTASR